MPPECKQVPLFHLAASHSPHSLAPKLTFHSNGPLEGQELQIGNRFSDEMEADTGVIVRNLQEFNYTMLVKMHSLLHKSTGGSLTAPSTKNVLKEALRGVLWRAR